MSEYVVEMHDIVKTFGHVTAVNNGQFTLKKGEIFFHAIYREASRLGGLVSGEHGIGSGKIDYLADSVGEINVELMKGIKKVFDPKGILNPGKVVRLDEENV